MRHELSLSLSAWASVALAGRLEHTPEPALAWDDGAATLTVAADADRDLPVLLSARVSFGPWEHRFEAWHAVPAGARAALPVELPAEAALHELTDRYVSRLDVVAWIHGVPHAVPPRWVWWPDGPDGLPEILDDAALAERAPHGVVDDAPELVALRERFGDSDFWLQPPVRLEDGVCPAPDGIGEDVAPEPEP